MWSISKAQADEKEIDRDAELGETLLSKDHMHFKLTCYLSPLVSMGWVGKVFTHALINSGYS